MKAASFLDMVTLLTATAKTEKEIDEKLSKLILLYNQPPVNLCKIFSNLYREKNSPNKYFDKNNAILFLGSNGLVFTLNQKQHTNKAPRNINELITTINAINDSFRLEFKENVVKELDLNPTFKEVMRAYGI